MKIGLIIPLFALCTSFSATAQGKDTPPRYVLSCEIKSCIIRSSDITMKLAGFRQSPTISVISFSGEVDDGAASVPMAMHSGRERVSLEPIQVMLFPEEWVADGSGNRVLGRRLGHFLIDNKSGLIRHYDRQNNTNVVISLDDLIGRLAISPSIFIESFVPRSDVCCSVRANYESHAFVKALRTAASKLPKR
jgi:hypothetical protein